MSSCQLLWCSDLCHFCSATTIRGTIGGSRAESADKFNIHNNKAMTTLLWKDWNSDRELMLDARIVRPIHAQDPNKQVLRHFISRSILLYGKSCGLADFILFISQVFYTFKIGSCVKLLSTFLGCFSYPCVDHLNLTVIIASHQDILGFACFYS